MKLLTMLVAAFMVVAGSLSAAAQCCCSAVNVTITNGAGFPLDATEVRVQAISRENRATLLEDKNSKAKMYFRIGCGNGREMMLLEYQGVEMRLRFKLYGDFGKRVELNVPFVAGDHVVEFEKEWSEDGPRIAVVRQADADEVKEAEEIQKANAAAEDKAANAPGSDPSP